jgi:molybdopterin synthase catalytic subunit
MIRLCDQPFDPAQALAAFSAGRAETGAIVSFTGLVRADDGAALALELEAYPGFTDAKIAEFAAEAARRFSLQDVAVVHRTGRMAVGEPVVFVATAAAHRRAAFDGCDYLMDYLKSRAPFWKKSHGPAGAEWIEPTLQDADDLARWERTLSR